MDDISDADIFTVVDGDTKSSNVKDSPLHTLSQPNEACSQKKITDPSRELDMQKESLDIKSPKPTDSEVCSAIPNDVALDSTKTSCETLTNDLGLLSEVQDSERKMDVSTDTSYSELREPRDIEACNHNTESNSNDAVEDDGNSFIGDKSIQDTCDVYKIPLAKVTDDKKLENCDKTGRNMESGTNAETEQVLHVADESLNKTFDTEPQSLDKSEICNDNVPVDVGQCAPNKETNLDVLSSQLTSQHTLENNVTTLPESPSPTDVPRLTESSLPTTDEGGAMLDSGLKKLITEVCACDTTTGSTDDELPSNSVSENVHGQTEKVSNENAESKIHRKTELPPSGKRSRKEWARELAKVRVKNQQRKKLARQTAILRARQSKRKTFEARKGVTVNRKNAASGFVQKSSVAAEVSKTPEIKLSDPLPEHNLPTCASISMDKVTKSSKGKPSAKTDDITKNFNNSANIDLGPIEIVEDEDDGDPWPFLASPATASNMPTPDSACSFKSQSPTLSLNQELSSVSKPSAKGEASLHGSMKTQVAKKSLSRTSSVKESVVQVASQVEKATDTIVAKVLPSDFDALEVPSDLDKALTSVAAVPSLDRTMAPATPSSAGGTELSSSPNIEEWSPGDVVLIPDSPIDQNSHAKMQRKCEVQRTNSLADSMWKDMFNSEVAPLDFDAPTTAAESKLEDQMLPAIFTSSLGLVRKNNKPPTASISGYTNTPCGDSYPADRTSLPAVTKSTLQLCSCKSNNKTSPACHNKTGQSKTGSLSFCQAVETVGKRVSNCVRSIPEKIEKRRVSPRLPYMELCKHHMKKLSQHSCCPICGLFCSGGNFLDCTSGKGHLHHEACQVKTDDGLYLCPHCGDRSSQVAVVLHSKSDTETQKTKQTSRKQNNEGIARMCIRLVTKATNPTSDGSSNHSYDNKLFEVSKSKLLDGAEKNKLITVMSGLEHMVPAMRERLAHGAGVTSVADLASCILKNDLSQLALGICDVMHTAAHKPDDKYPLNQPLVEHDSKTLLHLAVESGSLATVHCLVMAGVALNSSDSKGVTPLMLAAKNNQLDVLKYLIGAGAVAEWRDGDGMTPLHLAAVSGNKAICEYLLSEARVNVDCLDEGGWTPLVWAIENGHTHVVKLLLNSDASIHRRDSEGNASIHWGAYSGNTDIIKLLITRGADIEAVNELGDRPLHIAVRQARTDAVILLLSHGADTSAVNNLHQTPAECCHGACSENMKSFLAVNDVLRSTKIGDIITRSPRLLHQDIARGKEKLPISVTNDVDDTNYPTDFTYVTESVWTSRVPVNTMINSLSRCECSGDCSRASCACARSSISCWYDQGVLASFFDFTNPPQIYECNMACGCWATCNNRVVQHGITSQLELFKTKCRGWGVRARHEIMKGSFVCEYVGELITDSEADTREDDSYLFDLDHKDGDTYCMDAKQYGNISRFINHRCEPNLTPVNVFIDHQDIRFPRICLFANTDIEPGTELGFDYGEKFWLVKYKQFLCDCGCKTCKYNKENIDSTVFHHQQISSSPVKKSSSTT